MEVPRIDFSCAVATSDPRKLFASHDCEIESLAREIVDSFKDVGFFVAFNHGVATRTLRSVKLEALDFFSWDSSLKSSFARVDPQTELFGYTSTHSSTEIFDSLKPKDVKETFEFSMAGSDKVPTDVWQTHRKELSEAMTRLFKNTIALIAKGLGMETVEVMLDKVRCVGRGEGGNVSAFRCALYPQVKRNDLVEGQVRCGLHCDYGCLTFIYKAPFEKGLMSKQRRGDFVDVYCKEEGDLIVNAGEMLQMLTGDLIRAAPHQVVFPQGPETIPYAFSLIFFGNFDDEAEIETLDIRSENNASVVNRYEKFKAKDYFTRRLQNVFVEGRGLVEELLE